MPDPRPLIKTEFLPYLDCPLHLWATAHDRLASAPPSRLQQRLGEQGREIEVPAPEHADTLESQNERMFDLMDVFRKGRCRHPAFRGSASLQNVLPVLIPDLTYESLLIRDSEAARRAWWELVTGSLDANRRAVLERALRIYCALDAAVMMAMVAIWELLA